MVTVLNAEAGLSECARYDVCPTGLELWLGMWIVGFVLVTVWLFVALVATVDVLDTPLGSRRTARWLAVVCLIPVIGAILWFRSTVGTSEEPRGP